MAKLTGKSEFDLLLQADRALDDAHEALFSIYSALEVYGLPPDASDVRMRRCYEKYVKACESSDAYQQEKLRSRLVHDYEDYDD